MRTPTNKEIDELVHEELDSILMTPEIVAVAMHNAARRALALAQEPAEPETPDLIDRTGQMFLAVLGNGFFGPIVRSGDGEYFSDVGRITERQIVSGYFRRIPPKFPDMDADECREPGPDDDWYSVDGPEIVHHGIPVGTFPGIGRRRWIKNAEPAKAWPEGPFMLEVIDTCCTIRDGKGVLLGTTTHQAQAEAIALSLNTLPECVVLLRKLGLIDEDCRELLAEIEKAGFKMLE